MAVAPDAPDLGATDVKAATASLDVRALASLADASEVASMDAATREALRFRVLDLIGCACAGYRIGTFRAVANALDTPGPVPVWFAGTHRSVADALRTNVFMSHAAYMEDGSRSTGGHPSCTVTPVVLTAAAEHTGGREVTPREALAAIAFGYEVFLRVGERAYPAIVERGFQSTAVLAPLAAAAALARLQRLGTDATAAALAIAACQGAGLKAALRASAIQPLQVAQGCEAGRVAVRLAVLGAQGHAGILGEGFFPAYAGRETQGRDGAHSRILDTYIKIHGGCRGNHAPLDAFLGVLRQHGIAADALREVRVYVDRHTRAAEIKHPTTPEQAQFSIEFALAVAAIHGETSVFAFAAARLHDARVRDLMSRINVTHDAALDAGYPARRAARVEIDTDSGRFAAHVDYPVGEPENPVTGAMLCNKFEELARPVLGDDTELVRDLVLDMDRCVSLAPLLEALARPREQPSCGGAFVPARDAAVAD